MPHVPRKVFTLVLTDKDLETIIECLDTELEATDDHLKDSPDSNPDRSTMCDQSRYLTRLISKLQHVLN